MPRANRYFLPGYVWHINRRQASGKRQQFGSKVKSFKRFAPFKTFKAITRSEEALRTLRARLHRYIESHSFTCEGHRPGCNRSKHAANCWTNRAGVQRAQRQARCLLRRSVSRHRDRSRRASAPMLDLHRFEHGPRRCGGSSREVEGERVQRDSKSAQALRHH